MFANIKKYYKNKVKIVKDNTALENEHEDGLDSSNVQLMGNLGIEVKEVGFDEFERRNEPRDMLSQISFWRKTD